jgi:chromate transporter
LSSDSPLVAEPAAVTPSYSLLNLAGYFLQLGTIGFGGPVALVGYMHRDLVERRKWITETDYREGLALAQLAPGPLAAQLAIYLGYVHYGIAGATLAGVTFIVPSFLMVLALGWAYVKYGGLTWMQAVFYGVGASVIGIIAFSSWKLTRRTIGKDALLWLVYLASLAATIYTQSEAIWLFFLAGFVVWIVKVPPRFLQRPRTTSGLAVLPIALALPEAVHSDPDILWRIAWFFTKAGAFVFGSGLAIVPFLYGGVVKEFGWLNDQQFLDAVAVAMITPGPVVITVGFIGFLVAGLAGACVAALATFLPCYLFTVIPAPYFRKYGKRSGLAAFVEGVTAAAIGAISGAVVVLGERTLFGADWHLDWFKLAIMTATMCILLIGKRIPEPLIVLGAAIIGLIAYPILTSH